jgi:hypothetical protein
MSKKSWRLFTEPYKGRGVVRAFPIQASALDESLFKALSMTKALSVWVSVQSVSD